MCCVHGASQDFLSPSGKVTVNVLLVSNSNELCFGFDSANSFFLKRICGKEHVGGLPFALGVLGSCAFGFLL